MTTSVHIALISRQELEKLSREHVDLKTGDRLEGEVLDVRKDGKVTVDFGKFRTNIELKAPVQKGDVITATVAEKGKQIKLKLEHIQSKVAVEAQKAVKQAETMQAAKTNELQQQQAEQIVREEIQAPVSKEAYVKSADQMPREMRDALTKLQKILQSPENMDLKKLSAEIKGILDTLQSHADALDIGDKIAKPVAQLNAYIRDSGMPVDKEVREILTKIMDAAGKAGKLKNLDQLPEIKNIIEKELKPDIVRLKEIIDTQLSKAEPADRESLQQIKKNVDNLLKNIDRALENLPDKVGPKSAEAGPPPPKSDAAVEAVVKQISDLKAMVEKSGIPLEKETVDVINRLSETADKINRAKAPDQLPEIKSTVENQVKPDLQRLKETIDLEISRAEPADRRTLQEIKQAVDNLFKNVEKTADRLPDKVDARMPAPPPPRTDAAVETVVKQISDLIAMVEKSGIPLEKETAELIDRLSEAAEKVSRVKTAEQLPEIKSIIDNQLKTNLVRLKEVIDLEVARAEPVTRKAGREIKQSVDDILKNLEKTLEKLPDKIKTSERIETLLNDIKNIRKTLETKSENLEAGNRVLKQVSDIREMVQRSEIPFEKEVEVIVAKLAEAAAKISQLQSPEQIPELKTILDTELRPDLSALKEIIDRGADIPRTKPTPTPTPEDRQTVQEIKDRIETLQKEIEITLKELPGKEQSSREIRDLLKDIESALDKISDFSYIAGKGEFAEDIETLFENIKLALKQLHHNIESGKPLFDLPPEVRDIFANLQVNFDTGDMEKMVIQQISQLNALIETIRDSGFAADKRVEFMLAKLTEIVAQLGEMKSKGQWQQIMQTLQRDVMPNLKLLKQVFSPGESMENTVVRQQMTDISKSVETVEQQVGAFLEKASAQARSAEFAQFAESPNQTGQAGQAEQVPHEVKNIFSKLPKSLQTPENLSRLSENIQNAMEKTAGQAALSEGGASLPQGVKQMLSTLRTHFQPLDIGQDALKLVPKLKSLVEDSGIFFEKKIQDTIARLTEASARIGNIDNLNRLPEIKDIINNDLKPNLLLLREYFNSEKFTSELGRQDTFDAVRQSVEDLISNIAGQQSRAVDSQAQQNPVVVFSFNLPIKGEEDAQLKVFYNRGRKKDDAQEFKLSLLLDMDNLGTVRTDLSHWEENLTVTFFVKNYEIKDYIEENLHEVREPLESEFKALTFKVIVSEEDIAAFDAEPAVPEIISDKAVDVKV
jgi:DNA repair exonuclease SbcCD ATPase subunit